MARFVIGAIAPEEIVAWAITCLQRGINSPTLPVVAGYTEVELPRNLLEFRG